MYIKIEPSGCCERYGSVQVRFSMYLDEEDARYEEHHIYVVDQSCPIWQAGYKGAIDEEGRPVDYTDYEEWVDTCHHIWRDNPFHNHFVYADPDVTEAEIQSLAEFHLANFYEAWQQGKTIRSGWDVKHRIRPLRYNEIDEPSIYAFRKAQCEQKAEAIKSLNISVSTPGKGKTFPATDIDVGGGAIDRDDDWPFTHTIVDFNNPANDTGTIDTFEFWFYSNGSGVKAGTFYGTGAWPYTFTSRDVETIGNVSSGSKQTFTGLDCDVSVGDLAGIYYSGGAIDKHGWGGSNIYWKDGDQFGAGPQEDYTLLGEDRISIYGTGETPVGWTGKISGVTNPAKIMGVDVANIAKVKGVA